MGIILSYLVAIFKSLIGLAGEINWIFYVIGGYQLRGIVYKIINKIKEYHFSYDSDNGFAIRKKDIDDFRGEDQ